MRLIVTRPAAQAVQWVAALQALGQDAVSLPLIGIAEAPDAAAVHAAWLQLPSFDLAVFVSPNAVQQFFALRPPGIAWPPALLAGSTGPGTSAALQAAGVGAAQRVEPAADAPSFDSEALWAQLQARGWPHAVLALAHGQASLASAAHSVSLSPDARHAAAVRRVLVVRGDGGRNWLADTLQAHGAAVEFIAAYQRQPPLLRAAERALLNAAIARPAAHAWLFSSSEALQHLRALAPAADWSASRAVASHPRIVEAVRHAGFGRVALAPPVPAAVLDALAPLAQSGPL